MDFRNFMLHNRYNFIFCRPYIKVKKLFMKIKFYIEHKFQKRKMEIVENSKSKSLETSTKIVSYLY